MAFTVIGNGKLIYDLIKEVAKGASAISTIVDDVWKDRQVPPIVCELQDSWHELTKLAKECLADAEYFAPGTLDKLIRKTVHVGKATDQSIRQCSKHGYVVLRIRFIGVRVKDVKAAQASLELLANLKREMRARSTEANMRRLEAAARLATQLQGDDDEGFDGPLVLPVPVGHPLATSAFAGEEWLSVQHRGRGADSASILSHASYELVTLGNPSLVTLPSAEEDIADAQELSRGDIDSTVYTVAASMTISSASDTVLGVERPGVGGDIGMGTSLIDAEKSYIPLAGGGEAIVGTVSSLPVPAPGESGVTSAD